MNKVVDIPSIIDSVQVPALLKDVKIRQMELVRNNDGDPFRRTGGFAVVFQFSSGSEKWAFRCMYTPIMDISNRLMTISVYFKKLNLPFICDFEYSECGLIADGERIPTSRMKWVDGLNLVDFLFSNKRNPKVISDLSVKFLNLCKSLNKYSIHVPQVLLTAACAWSLGASACISPLVARPERPTNHQPRATPWEHIDMAGTHAPKGQKR